MESNELTQRFAKDLVNQIAVIVRTAQIHNPANVAVVSSVEKFVSLVNTLAREDGPVTLELVGEYFYLNEERIKFSMEYLLNFDFLQREFKRRSLGSLRFACEVNAGEMQTFLSAFLNSQYSPDPFDDLTLGMSAANCIECGRIRRIVEDDNYDLRKAVKRTYFNAVSYTRGVMNKIKAGERVSIKRAKRVIESMVDLLLEKEELLLGMTAIKNYDEYTYHHSVNVSILSVALGQRLGLGKKALMELGLVALFHDIGKTEIPSEILNKPTSFTGEEWEMMKGHTLLGVSVIFRMKGFDSSSIRAAIACYEHHIHHDKTGYPKVQKLSDLDFYSRIVGIADQYDGMTSSRVYARVPLAPDRALSLMMKRAGAQLDALLFKFFVNLVGIYPVGSLVMLDTRELAIVCSASPSEHLRPRVVMITDDTGIKAGPRTVDLTEKDPGGKHLRSIVKALDPAKYKVNIAEYLL